MGHWTSNIGHPTFHVELRKSDIGHWTSDVGHRTTVVGRWTSVIGHQTSHIGHWKSDIRRRISDTRHRTSDIGHRTSGIGHQDIWHQKHNRCNGLFPYYHLHCRAHFNATLNIETIIGRLYQDQDSACGWYMKWWPLRNMLYVLSKDAEKKWVRTFLNVSLGQHWVKNIGWSQIRHLYRRFTLRIILLT